MINPSIVNELGEDIFQQALQIFLRNCEIDMLSLKKAFQNSDTQEVKSMSHKLTGTFGSVRVEEIPDLLREINESSSKMILEKETFEKVEDLYSQLKIYIKDNFSVETPS